MVDVGTGNVLRTGTLVDEVNLAYSINELMHSLSDLATELGDADLSAGSSAYSTRNTWAEQLQNFAGGPVNTLSQDALNFALARADELEGRCGR